MTTAVPLPVVPSHTVPPLVVLEHALLALTLEVNPTTVLVGDTASITVTVRNTTGRTATDVVVTLRAPAESVPVPAPAYQPAQRHWQWMLPHLAAFESHSMTAQVRVVRLPDGAALVATAAAIGANSPRQTRILRQISIESNPNASWNVVHQYRLEPIHRSV